MCIIDQACFVKIAEYWLTSFCSFYGLRQSQGKKTHKEEWRQYPAILTEQAARSINN